MIIKAVFCFFTLPSGRRLAYVKPRMGENQFGGETVTYEGVGATKKWERLESYGPKFTENAVQAIARDILMYAMQTLSHCSIVAHVHDEIIIECDRRVSLEAVCEQMGRTPPWAEGLLLRADGYECDFYKKRLIFGGSIPSDFSLIGRRMICPSAYFILRRIRYGRINQNQL